MNHVRIIAVVFALALAMTLSGCVDSDSSKENVSQEDGAPSGTAHYLDLTDVTSLHYKAAVSADNGDTVVFEEWRKKSGDAWFFKSMISSNQGADSVTILQNADGIYIIDEEGGTVIKTGECSDDNIGYMNPFWGAYGCYSDDSTWDDSWVIDSDTTYLGRKAVKLDYGKVRQFAGTRSDEDVTTERADLIVDKRTGFTLLLDWACTYDGESESLHYEVTEFDLNADIPDDMFDIPAGSEIFDLPELGEMGGSMSGMASGGPGSPPIPE